MPRLGDLETACIPDAFVNRFVVDARELCLVSERNDDSSRQLAAILPAQLQALSCVVESELPLAIEIEPLVANKLWSGIFRTRNRFSHRHMTSLTGDLRRRSLAAPPVFFDKLRVKSGSLVDAAPVAECSGSAADLSCPSRVRFHSQCARVHSPSPTPLCV